MVTALCISSEKSKADITFENTSYDFGQMYDDEGPIRYKFIFHNTGRRQLEVQKIDLSCGCMAATSSREQFQPNESGFIDVHINTLGRSGRLTENLIVYTNDSTYPHTVLTIQGMVKQLVIITPDIISFGPLKPGAIETQQLRVMIDQSKMSSQITNITSDLTSINIQTYNVRKSQEQLPTNEYIYDISAKGNSQTFQEKGDICIRTSHPKAKLLKVPVAVEHTGNLIVSPKCLFLGSVKPNQEIERTLKILSLDDKPFKISTVSAIGPWILTNQPILTLNDNPSQSLKLKFECAQKLTKSFLKGVLTLTTNLEQHPVITLPIMAIRQQQNLPVTN